MSAKFSPTKIKRRKDLELVKKTLIRAKFQEYSDKINPFKLGSLRFERFKRYYIKEKDYHEWMDSIFEMYHNPAESKTSKKQMKPFLSFITSTFWIFSATLSLHTFYHSISLDFNLPELKYSVFFKFAWLLICFRAALVYLDVILEFSAKSFKNTEEK